MNQNNSNLPYNHVDLLDGHESYELNKAIEASLADQAKINAQPRDSEESVARIEELFRIVEQANVAVAGVENGYLLAQQPLRRAVNRRNRIGNRAGNRAGIEGDELKRHEKLAKAEIKQRDSVLKHAEKLRIKVQKTIDDAETAVSIAVALGSTQFELNRAPSNPLEFGNPIPNYNNLHINNLNNLNNISNSSPYPQPNRDIVEIIDLCGDDDQELVPLSSSQLRSIQNSISTFTKCTVCFDGYNRFRTPLLLPCGHRTCIICFRTLPSIKNHANEQHRVKACPLCKKATKLANCIVDRNFIELDPRITPAIPIPECPFRRDCMMYSNK
jgi:hypothetical protein